MNKIYKIEGLNGLCLRDHRGECRCGSKENLRDFAVFWHNSGECPEDVRYDIVSRCPKHDSSGATFSFAPLSKNVKMQVIA